MAKQTIKNYHYINDDGGLIRIRGKRRPSRKNIPWSGTYIVNEFDPKSKTYKSPCFPEIIAHRLFNICVYLGSTKDDRERG